MLILALPVTDIALVRAQIHEYESRVDGFELRFDFLTTFDWPAIQTLRDASQKPMIFTLRSKDQGGQWQGDEALRWEYIQALCACRPEYIDLEYHMPIAYFTWVKQHFPMIKVIGSLHQFSPSTSIELPTLPCDILKMAQWCETGFEALAFLNAVHAEAKEQPFVAIAMGEHAQFARVLGPILGNYFDYVALDAASCTGAGQLSLDACLDIYHYRTLNQETAIYALLGHPVAHSIGHLFHNEAFLSLKHNAVYVKIDILPADLSAALKLLQNLPFQGFSMTMPHKKAIAHLVETDLVSVNTLKKIGPERWAAYNTDGEGALKAMQELDTRIQPVLILGAGGAAMAIAETLMDHGYPVYSLNPRSYKPNSGVGIVLHPDLETFPEFAWVINTLPKSAFLPESKAWHLVPTLLKSYHKVLNIDYAHESYFDTHASDLGCLSASGKAMFYHQAQAQLTIWLEHN